MPTNAEVIAAKDYYTNLYNSTASLRNTDYAQWKSARDERNAYYFSLPADQQIIFAGQSAEGSEAAYQQWKRDVETRSRERTQTLVKAAPLLVGGALALPILFSGGGAAAAEFVGPPESIAGVGQAASFVGPPTSIAGVGGIGIGGAGDVAAAAMENQVIPSGGILGTIGDVGKVIGGGIDTLATVIPKVDTIYRTIEGVLGKEDQETIDIRDNPAGDLPSSSSPVVNLTIPPQSTGGIVLTTPAAGQPNVMLYAGLAIIAIILFKGL